MVYPLSSKNVCPYVKAERVYAEMGPKNFMYTFPSELPLIVCQ